MRISLTALLCFLSVANSSGQNAGHRYGRADVEITKEGRKKIAIKVEVKSDAPGLDSSLAKYIETNLNPSVWYNKRIKKATYVVSVQFIVAKDSSITDIRPLTNLGFGMEAEVVRTVKKYGWWPRWKPAPQSSPIRAYRTSSTTSQ